MSVGLNFSVGLKPAAAAAAVQAAVAATGGSLGDVNREQVECFVPPYGPQDLLKALWQRIGDTNPLSVRITVTVTLTPVAGGTSINVSSLPSLYYMMDALGLTQRTLNAFVQLIGESCKAIVENRRPPSEWPPL